jgi:hypothetical protein
MLCVVCYTSKVLHNIDKGDRGVFGHEILHKIGKYVYGNQKWSKGYAISTKCAKDFWSGLSEYALSYNFIS